MLELLIRYHQDLISTPEVGIRAAATILSNTGDSAASNLVHLADYAGIVPITPDALGLDPGRIASLLNQQLTQECVVPSRLVCLLPWSTSCDSWSFYRCNPFTLETVSHMEI